MNGLVSSRPKKITTIEKRGFSTHTAVTEADSSLTIRHAEQYTNLTFDALLLDCEYCIDTIFDAADLKNIQLIL